MTMVSPGAVVTATVDGTGDNVLGEEGGMSLCDGVLGWILAVESLGGKGEKGIPFTILGKNTTGNIASETHRRSALGFDVAVAYYLPCRARP